MDEEFEAFWQQYPRKVAKGYARRQWPKARRLASFEEIMEGVERYRKEVQGKEPQYIAHPSTWLNGERWTDEVGVNRSAEPPARKPPPGFWQPTAFQPIDAKTKEWNFRMKCWRESNLWMTSWGPKPGEPHCEVPRHLLAGEGNAA